MSTTQTKINKSIANASWVSLSLIFARLLNPISSAILARLLDSTAFGIISIIQIFMIVIDIFRDMGITKSLLIYHGDKIEEFSSTAFYAVLAGGIFSVSVLWLISPLVSSFFNENILELIIKIAAVRMLFFSLQNIPEVLIQRQGKWILYSILNMTAPITTSISTVILAFCNFGVWSIIYGTIIGSLLKLILMYILFPWKPKLHFNFKQFKELSGYGKWVIGYNLLTFFVDTADNAYLARFQGAANLGYYSLPYSWITYPNRYILYAIQRTTFPTLSKIKEKQEQKEVVIKIIGLISFIIFPIYMYLIFNAHYFVLTVFGEKWMRSIEIVRWLSIYGILRGINEFTCSFFIATKKARFGVIPQVISIIFIIAGFLISWGQWGAVAIAALFTSAMAVRVLSTVFIFIKYYAMDMLKYSFSILSGIIPSLFAAVSGYLVAELLPVGIYSRFGISLCIFLILYLFLYSSVKYRNPFKLYLPSTWKVIIKQYVKK
jgi:O-antigen/teichoic acid export membrane protein